MNSPHPLPVNETLLQAQRQSGFASESGAQVILFAMPKLPADKEGQQENKAAVPEVVPFVLKAILTLQIVEMASGLRL